MNSRKKAKVQWLPAPDIQKKIKSLCTHPDFSHVKTSSVHCFRSTGSKARAYARIWGLPQIFKLALNTGSHYCLEVISEKFDPLNQQNQTRTLIHELLHIPKTFSGALLPHRTGSFHLSTQRVEKIYKSFPKKRPQNALKNLLFRK